MSRATNIIRLLEAGGLENTGASIIKNTIGNNKFVAKPGTGKGGGDLRTSSGFEYGSGSKEKNKQLSDAEYNDNQVDTPVLVGNMFKRDKSKDRSSSKKKPTMISMTGLHG